MPAQCVVCVRNSLFTQFFRLSGMRPGGGKQLHYRETPRHWSQYIKPAELQLKNGFHRTYERDQTPGLSNHLTNVWGIKKWYWWLHVPDVPVIARRISRAASSRISMEACSLYQAAWGVQIRLGASLRGPWLKLSHTHMQLCKSLSENDFSIIRTFHNEAKEFSSSLWLLDKEKIILYRLHRQRAKFSQWNISELKPFWILYYNDFSRAENPGNRMRGLIQGYYHSLKHFCELTQTHTHTHQND